MGTENCSLGMLVCCRLVFGASVPFSLLGVGLSLYCDEYVSSNLQNL